MRLLLIEDDESLCLSLSYQLRQDGFAPETCHDGEEGLLWARQQGYDLILLDRMLPGMDGLTLLRQLRREGIHTPVIFLTALGQLGDKTGGLDAGADDYVAKPFRPRELVSRMRNALRRRNRTQTITYSGITVDTVKGIALKDGKDLYLSALEYRLLLIFFNNMGAVLSRNRLLEEIWDIAGEYVNDNTLTVYIKRLRDKIEDDPQNPQIIKTVRGMGYKAGE